MTECPLCGGRTREGTEALLRHLIKRHRLGAYSDYANAFACRCGDAWLWPAQMRRHWHAEGGLVKHLPEHGLGIDR